eukprot:9023477-Pyramimonas_sp.AAC.1
MIRDNWSWGRGRDLWGRFCPIRAWLCRGLSGFIWLGEVCHRFPALARVPGCPGARVPGCPGAL